MVLSHKSLIKLYISEFVGTALLVFAGLSAVIIMNGAGSPVEKFIPSPMFRRYFTGLLFGTVGCLITISPVGKISGAHINPAVSLAFYLRHKMKLQTMLGYIVAQMIGAAIGAFPLLLWGTQGSSLQYGMTSSGSFSAEAALIGETITTFILIIYLFIMLGSERFRNYTPFGIPFLYCLMVGIEAPVSGCSTNPARSFGPALICNNFQQFWIFCIGPILGVLAAVLLFRFLRLRMYYKIESARVSFLHSPTHPNLKSS